MSQQSSLLDAPNQAPYARHLFICVGKYCDPEGRSARLYQQLGQKLGDLGRYDNALRVKRGVTPCLGVCHNGPLLVVYPEGIWYTYQTKEDIDEILQTHVVGGGRVERLMLQPDQTEPRTVSPA